MIIVTGATGQLGRLVVAGLLARIPATEVAVAVRTPGQAVDLAERGVEVRHADYDKPETLDAAFAGAKKLLLISSNELGRRAAQHHALVGAAKNAGVEFLAYTSILRAETSGLALAADHKITEHAIRASGLAFAFLRNSWYIENHTGQVGPALERGAIAGAAGDGRFASAARADYAAAAVAVLTGDDRNAVYELPGSAPYTLSEVADEVSRQAGKRVVYENLAPEQFKAVLLGAGLPEVYAALLVDSDVRASLGELDGSAGDLERLIGRPSMTLTDAVATGLKVRNHALNL
jgi:NAD(P)H dehydrogenase (quinone)